MLQFWTWWKLKIFSSLSHNRCSTSSHFILPFLIVIFFCTFAVSYLIIPNANSYLYPEFTWWCTLCKRPSGPAKNIYIFNCLQRPGPSGWRYWPTPSEVTASIEGSHQTSYNFIKQMCRAGFMIWKLMKHQVRYSEDKLN